MSFKASPSGLLVVTFAEHLQTLLFKRRYRDPFRSVRAWLAGRRVSIWQVSIAIQSDKHSRDNSLLHIMLPPDSEAYLPLISELAIDVSA